MNPRRFTIVAPTFCGTVVLAGWVVGWLAGFGSAGTENTGAVPIEDRAASLAANARLADEPQAIAMGNAVVANTVVANAAVASAEVATAAEPAAGTATDTTAASDKPESIVVAALPDPSQTLSADLPPVQKSVDLGHHDVAQPVPTTCDASGGASTRGRRISGISFVMSGPNCRLPRSRRRSSCVRSRTSRSERRSRRSSARPTLSVWISIS